MNMRSRRSSTSAVLLTIGFLVLAVGTVGVTIGMSNLGGNGYPRSQVVVENLLQVLAFMALAAGWWWLSSGLSRVVSSEALAARGTLLLAIASLLFAGSYGMQAAVEERAFNPSLTYHLLLGSMLIQTAGAVVVAIGFVATFLAHGRREGAPAAAEQVAAVPNEVH